MEGANRIRLNPWLNLLKRHIDHRYEFPRFLVLVYDMLKKNVVGLVLVIVLVIAIMICAIILWLEHMAGIAGLMELLLILSIITNAVVACTLIHEMYYRGKDRTIVTRPWIGRDTSISSEYYKFNEKQCKIIVKNYGSIPATKIKMFEIEASHTMSNFCDIKVHGLANDTAQILLPHERFGVPIKLNDCNYKTTKISKIIKSKEAKIITKLDNQIKNCITNMNIGEKYAGCLITYSGAYA